ncbi:hypothetical protein GIB67_018361 [Kingdonia uniflora]|uniref:Glycolipid transfer protein domain-containing protein n=1 Tax=Kingdonia uniflora TaxID=39325 RepID=A0A7J7MJG5_9MAGN|nr:hypothetical protein GIB67_018361 [Kingdonia uniflora]
MKRRREVMEKVSEIRCAIEELSSKIVKLKTSNHEDHSGVNDHVFLPAKPFLQICYWLLQVLDKIGPTMVVLRQDVHQNIQRIEKLLESDPSVYSNLVEMLKKEAREGNARATKSCTRAFVWLTRSMDLTAVLLEKIMIEPGQAMEKVVEESYNVTLKPWHGWISTAAYKVALKLVPVRKIFISLLMNEEEDYDMLKNEIQSLNSILMPVLAEIHSILNTFRADRLNSA